MSDNNQKVKSMLILSVVLFFLTALKAIIGITSNSSSLTSDAVQSGADLVVAIISFIGLKIAHRPPDKKFNYGYYKIENLVSLIISLALLATVISLIVEGIKRIISPAKLGTPFLAMGASSISVLVSLGLGIYLINIARKTKSPTIEANAKDKLSDTFLSLAVLVSIILTYFEIRYVEGIVTIIVSLLILRVGFQIGKDSLFGLLDITNIELKNKINLIISEIAGVKDHSKLRLRKAGAYYIGDCEIVVEESIDVGKAHEIIEKVVSEVKKNIPEVISFVVEIEPTKKKTRTIIIPIKENEGLESQICSYFNDASSFLFITADMVKKEIKEYKDLENPFYYETTEGVFTLAKMIENKGIDTVIVKEIGEVGFNQLKAEKVEIFQCQNQLKIEQIIKKLFERGLRELEKPTDENSI